MEESTTVKHTQDTFRTKKSKVQPQKNISTTHDLSESSLNANALSKVSAMRKEKKTRLTKGSFRQEFPQTANNYSNKSLSFLSKYLRNHKFKTKLQPEE